MAKAYVGVLHEFVPNTAYGLAPTCSTRDDAYYHKVIPAEIVNFIDAVALTVAQHILHNQTDSDINDGP